MQELTQYVATANRTLKQLGQTEYDINIFWHRVDLSRKILLDLEPENLSCDGEFAPGGWRARQREMFLTRALEQLDNVEEHLNMGVAAPIGYYNG